MPFKSETGYSSLIRKSTASSAGGPAETHLTSLPQQEMDRLGISRQKSSTSSQHFAVMKRGSRGSVVSFLRRKSDRRETENFKISSLIHIFLWIGSIIIFSALTFAITCYFLCQQVSKEDVCLTEPCVKIGAAMLSKMNRSIDPCTDFYEYACGGWNHKTRIPQPRVPSWNPIIKAGNDALQLIRDDFDAHFLRANERNNYSMGYQSSAQEKVAIWYRSCADEKKIKSLGVTPLLEFVTSIEGWGLVNGSTVESYQDWSLQNTLEVLLSNQVSPLFWIGVEQDEKNISRNMITIVQPQLSLKIRSHYVNETENQPHPNQFGALPILKELIVAFGELLGGEDKKTLVARATGVLEFEQELALIMDPDHIQRNTSISYSLQTLATLQAQSPELDWHQLLKSMYGSNNTELTDSSPIVVLGIEFFERLSALLRKFSSTMEGRRTLDDYMKWRVILSVGFHVHLDLSRYYPRVQYLHKYLSERDPRRWVHCLKQAMGLMPDALATVYLAKIENRDLIKKEVSKLTEHLIESLKEEIQQLSWMDRKTKATALSKVNKTVALVGYSENLNDLDAVDAAHESLEVKYGRYFENMMSGLKLYRRRNMALLSKKPVRAEWGRETSPITGNAYYGFQENRIVIPLAILVPQLYVFSAPEYVNLGAIGSIVGHELTHGFDERGRRYGEFGNVRPWWSAEASEEYLKRSKCLVDQYSDMTHTYSNGIEMTGNGASTLNENIADNGGLKLAYLTYRKQSRNSLPLPGLNLTVEQTFFLSFAQNWCSVTREDYIGVSEKNEPHSHERFRVTGSLRNMEEFSKAFSCPLNSPMNPAKKCSSLW